VGQVLSAHGIKGETRFRYYSDDGSAALEYRRCVVYRTGEEVELESFSIRRQGASFIIKFKGLDTIEQIGFLLKQELLVHEADLPRLGEDEYYDYQLVGLEVVTEEGRQIGRVREIMHTGANDILVIDGRTEALVPMTEDHIRLIDTGAGLIRIRESELVA